MTPILPILPSWLTLEQAAAWLTDKTEIAGMTWTADILMGALATTSGPLRGIRRAMPAWLSINAELFINNEPATPLRGQFVCLTHKTLEQFSIHSSMDSGSIAIRSSNRMEDAEKNEPLFLKSGAEVPRTWIVVQGPDLLQFLHAYCGVMSQIQKRQPSLSPASEAVTPTEAPALKPQAMPASGPVTPAAALSEQADDAGLSKRERQIRAIESAIAKLGYLAMGLKTGEKKKVQDECNRASNLFGAGIDPFKDAWQEALNQNRVRTVRFPDQPGHPFHAKVDTDSTPKWTRVPAQTGH